MVTQQTESIARRTVFDALSRLFIAPGMPDTLDEIRSGLSAAVALSDELGLDKCAFERVISAEIDNPSLVAREYARLFSGANALPLHESAWNERGADVTALAQLECRGLYIEAGLETAALNGISEDHLGVEFAFMTVLILKERHKESRVFFERHLGRWLPVLAKAIRQRPEASFFRVIADVLDAIVDIERTLRQEAL